MKHKFSRILIANRGEIALRIIRTAREMGISTVAIYTTGEEHFLHVAEADSAESLGAGDLNDTYLNIDKIISIAKKTGVEAIHPGYGFLSENARFAEACSYNNLVFIGPSAKVLQQMGNKIIAKSIARQAGVNVSESIKVNPGNLNFDIEGLNFPVLIKASYGGGGKGMQIVRNPGELNQKLEKASRAATNYFGNGEIYIENYIEDARHIEVQILGDKFGNLVHLFERDCTIQRQHQKIIEEAPASGLSNEVRAQIHQAALAIGHRVGYENAGTVEFLVDLNNHFYFLEMNPRIQVEHTVTEQITGVDLIREQLNIAAGNQISFQQNEMKATGHSIELRVYQEDPANNYTPSTKSINYFKLPSVYQFRVETDLTEGQKGTVQFDPLILKLIATSPTREETIEALKKGLNEMYIDGPATNLNYLKAILHHPQFIEQSTSTLFCEDNHQELIKAINLNRSNVDLRFVIAAAIFSEFYSKVDKSPSVWEEIGFWRLDQRLEMAVDGVTNPIQWIRIKNDFQLKIGNQTSSVVLMNHKNNTLKINIDGEIQHIAQISFGEGQTRIGVDGFIFEVFCADVLGHYPCYEENELFIDEPASNRVRSHLFGKIETINIEINQTVEKGDILLIINSMKSEIAVIAPKIAKIKNINVSIGEQVSEGTTLVFLEDV